MSWYGARETIKASVLAVGLGLHYEDDSTIGDLANSVASDFDGTVLFSNTGQSDLDIKSFRLQDIEHSRRVLTVQIATDVGFERFQSDRLCELRGEAVIDAILASVPQTDIYDELKSVKLLRPPTVNNIAGGTKLVWEAQFLVDYRTVPTPIVYYNQESVANGATEDVNTGNAWLTKSFTLYGGGAVSNTSPLDGTQSIDLDGVNDYGVIKADHGDHLDFKIAEPCTFVFDVQYKGTGNYWFFLARNRHAASTISDFYFSPPTLTTVRLYFHDSAGTLYHKEWTLAGTLADTLKRSLAFRYKGTKTLGGWDAFENGVQLSESLVTPSNTAVFTNEILAGTETSAETEYKVGAAGQATATGFSNLRFDRIGIFGEALTDADILAIANGTAPDQLTR